MATVRAIADPWLAAGFRMAGLAVDEATTALEASAILARVAATPGTGVILISQAWFDTLPEPQRRALEQTPVPIVVPVPAPEWHEHRGTAESYILDLLQRAIGYRVRLQ